MEFGNIRTVQYSVKWGWQRHLILAGVLIAFIAVRYFLVKEETHSSFWIINPTLLFWALYRLYTSYKLYKNGNIAKVRIDKRNFLYQSYPRNKVVFTLQSALSGVIMGSALYLIVVTVSQSISFQWYILVGLALTLGCITATSHWIFYKKLF